MVLKAYEVVRYTVAMWQQVVYLVSEDGMVDYSRFITNVCTFHKHK